MRDFETENRQAALRRIHLEQAIRELPPRDESTALKVVGAIALAALWAGAVFLACL